MAGIDNIVRSGGEGVAPCEFGLGSCLDVDHGGSRFGWVGSTVADDVVGSNLSDGLYRVSHMYAVLKDILMTR